MNYVSLPEYRAASATDDNAALAAALATGKPVYLPAGGGSGSGGIYQIGVTATSNPANPGNLPSQSRLFGDGIGRTVVQRYAPTGEYVFMANSGSASAANERLNITLTDMTIQSVGGQTSVEQAAQLVHLSNTRNFLAERVEFRQFEGDALYFGNHINGQPGQNSDATVRDCLFDGINRINRNAISIVAGTDWLIENCTFRNVSADGQPGPIDVEPNPGDQVGRGRVFNCLFVGNGGAAVSTLLGNSTNGQSTPNASAVKDITVEGCTILSSFGGFSFGGSGDAASSVEEYGVAYRRNFISDTTRPFAIGGGYGISFEDNLVEDCDSSFVYAGATTRNLRILRNRFTRCGNVNGPVVIQNGNVIDVDVTDNHFLDCGRPDGVLGPVWYQSGDAGQADINRIRFFYNRLESPTTPHRMTDLGRRVGGSMAAQNAVQKVGNEFIDFTPIGPNNL